MPEIVRLRFLGEETVTVAPLGRSVEPDCLLEFPGVLEENEDHYLIEAGNPPESRCWPKSRWANETPAGKKAKTTTETEE